MLSDEQHCAANNAAELIDGDADAFPEGAADAIRRLLEPNDLTREVLGDVNAVVNYNWADEARDFEEWTRENGVPMEDQTDFHIFQRLERIDTWIQEVTR